MTKNKRYSITVETLPPYPAIVLVHDHHHDGPPILRRRLTDIDDAIDYFLLTIGE